MKLIFVGLVICLAALSKAQDLPPPCNDVSATCMMACDFGFKRDANGCHVCSCEEEICADVVCAVGKVCNVYSLSTSGHSISRCVDPLLPERCQMPLDGGSCRGYFASFTYNTDTDACEPFIYSGCQGNDNRFENLEDCQTFCTPPVECPPVMCHMYCEHGFKKDERGCESCACEDEAPADPCGGDSAVACTMFCEYGFQKDLRGCDICQCVEPLEVEPYGVECGAEMAMCLMHCERGFKRDERGCEKCECQENPCDSRPVCAMACEYGFRRDSDGCDMCECLEKQPRGACDDLQATCLMDCPNGFQQDERGCDVCRCKEPCHEIMCAMFCESGFQKDASGCDVCRCVGDLPLKPFCEAPKCRMFCEYGFQLDSRGCEICRCQENQCDDMECEDGEKCILLGNPGHQRQAKCVGELERTWCHNKRCKKFCDNGFKTDDLGCEICDCLDEPKPQCSPGACRMMCEYGFRYDQFGCMLCECLPDPCLAKTCDLLHVCESVKSDCDMCPTTAQCITFDRVQRIRIELHFVHSEIDGEIDDEEFQNEFRRRFSYLLSMDEEYIRGMAIKRPDPSLTIIVFHAVSYGDGDLVNNYKKFQADLASHAEGTAITYDDVVYIPEHRTLAATYSQDPDFYYGELDDDDDDDRTAKGIIIGCSVAGGIALILLIVVIVFIVKGKKQKKKFDRPNVSYIRAKGDKKKIVNDRTPSV